jgi:hypothetical protein
MLVSHVTSCGGTASSMARTDCVAGVKVVLAFPVHGGAGMANLAASRTAMASAIGKMPRQSGGRRRRHDSGIEHIDARSPAHRGGFMAGDPCRLARRHSSSADPHRRLPCDVCDAAAAVDSPPTGTDARVRSDPLRCRRSRPARRPTIRAIALGLFGGRSCLRRARRLRSTGRRTSSCVDWVGARAHRVRSNRQPPDDAREPRVGSQPRLSDLVESIRDQGPTV